MKRPKTKKSTDKTHEVVEFMTEFARFLLAAGISRNRFARIVEFAYFQAASRNGRFLNNRPNQSAIAAMTGLTRTQVRLMLRRARAVLESTSDRIDSIVGAWTSDAEYVTATFSPRRLRLEGASPSFSALVRKVGGDIPPRSILRELQRQRLVSVEGQYVKLTRAAQNEMESRSLRQLSSALARVIQTSGDTDVQASPIRTITMEMCYPESSSAGRILMQRRLSKILKGLAVEVEAAGSTVALESPPKAKSTKSRMTRVRLLFLTRESDA